MPDELPRRPLYKRLNTVGSRVLLSVLYLTLEVFESTTLQAIGCRLQNTVFEPSDDQKSGGGSEGRGDLFKLYPYKRWNTGVSAFFLDPGAAVTVGKHQHLLLLLQYMLERGAEEGVTDSLVLRVMVRSVSDGVGLSVDT